MKEFSFTFTVLFDSSKAIFKEEFKHCANQFELTPTNSESQIAMLSLGVMLPLGKHTPFYTDDIRIFSKKINAENPREIYDPSNVLKSKDNNGKWNFTKCLDAEALFNYTAGGKEKARFFCSLNEALDEYSKSLKDHFQCANNFIEKYISDVARNGVPIVANHQYFTQKCSAKHLAVLGDINKNIADPYVQELKSFGLLDKDFALDPESYPVLNPKCEKIKSKNAIEKKDFERRELEIDGSGYLPKDFFVTINTDKGWRNQDEDAEDKGSENAQNTGGKVTVFPEGLCVIGEESADKEQHCKGSENAQNTGVNEIESFVPIKTPDVFSYDDYRYD